MGDILYGGTCIEVSRQLHGVSGGVWRYCIVGNFRGRKLP